MKFNLAAVSLLVVLALGAFAQSDSQNTTPQQNDPQKNEPQKAEPQPERHHIAVGLGFGIYSPSDSQVRDAFGSTWVSFSISPISLKHSEKWKLRVSLSNLTQDNNGNKLFLLPITVGFEHAFGPRSAVRPYVSFGIGPYYGDVSAQVLGIDDKFIGFNANATAGLLISRAFYVEVKYDYFSPYKSVDFSGASLRVGVKIFDIRF